jgi:hypothetical protein
MQSKTNKSFTSLLLETPDLHKFVNKVEQLKQIHQLISTKLDPSLANHWQVANLREGTLVLTTSSPAWHHKLRFSAMDLLSALRADTRWSGLKAIDIRVDYLPLAENTSETKSRSRINISAQSAGHIQQSAQSISHKKLAEALSRLAKKAQGNCFS